MINTYTPVVPSKTITDSRPKQANLYLISVQNDAKTLPFGTAHTYVAYIKEYPPGLEGGPFAKSRSQLEDFTHINPGCIVH